MGVFIQVLGWVGIVFGAVMWLVGFFATDFQLGMGAMTTMLGVVAVGIGAIVNRLDTFNCSRMTPSQNKPDQE